MTIVFDSFHLFIFELKIFINIYIQCKKEKYAHMKIHIQI